jgi:hypothetical protein
MDGSHDPLSMVLNSLNAPAAPWQPAHSHRAPRTGIGPLVLRRSRPHLVEVFSMTTHVAELACGYALGFLIGALFADTTTMIAIAVVGGLHIVIASARGDVDG